MTDQITLKKPTPPPSENNISEDETAAWLSLIRSPGIGSKRIGQLLTHIGTPQTILATPRQRLKERTNLPQKCLNSLGNVDDAIIQSDLTWLSHTNNHLITIHDSRYPALLKQIPDPPPALFVCGNPALLGDPQVAMVGSRNPDHYGQAMAFEFANTLAQNGLTITSGLAMGIDAASHRGALQHGETIAVAATGLDRVYPACHKELAHEIAIKGVVVSEQPLGTPPIANQFPRRNRIISGLSLGTFVIQAAVQSGSLITARLASEQGREVFALPGSVHNPLSRGCHQLIRQGAKLVENTQDIIEELSAQLSTYISEQSKEPTAVEHAFTGRSNNEIMNQNMDKRSESILTDNQQQLLNYLGYETASIDTLVERSKQSSEAVTSMLLELELLGQVKSAAGLYSRT